ncbi:MAG: DUF1499 domain-containing protein [Planctomycetota bacterium]
MIPSLIALACVLSPIVVMATYVDDWSRDLTTNTARTSVDAADTRLRPIQTTADTATIRERLSPAENRMPHWEIADEKPTPDGWEGFDAIETVHLVRTTGLMRYQDDVWVLVGEPNDKGVATVHADSRSRVGKGDLGQNPRNLRELLGHLRAWPDTE